MRTTRQSRNASPRASNANGRRRRPLLYAVEDDPATLELLEEVASDAGWAARGFSHLSDFERAISKDVPDLVILDDELPDGRGGDRAREMRGDGRLRGVPVLVCTAAAPRRQAEIGSWAPVMGKPFDVDEIERLLELTARSRHLEVREAAG